MERFNGHAENRKPADLARHDHVNHSLPPPPPPDEFYWAALLREGERSEFKPDRHAPWDAAEMIVPPQAGTGHHNEDADWDLVTTYFQADRVIDLTVVGYNRGGLLMQWGGLRGFVPASQLNDFPNVPDGQLRRAELAAKVGGTLTLRVIELNREMNRLVLSERAAVVQPGTRAHILDQLQTGDTAEGHVTNLCDFGAFIDLGGLEGLIHISELSWGRVSHPRDILARGQTIRVHVMEVNREHGRVALSLKRMLPDPWETVEQRYHIGQFIEGNVTNVVDFGAFVGVEEGLEGLIHVSELAEGNFLHPRNVLKEGVRVRARILTINGHNRRLGLSLRQYDTLHDIPLSAADDPDQHPLNQ